MSTGITANTILGLVANYTGALQSGISQPIAINLPFGQNPTQFANGTAAVQVSGLAAAANRALVASTPVTDDLTTLTTAYVGPTTNFTSTGVKIFAVTNNETVAGHTLVFSGGASNPWLGPLGGTTPTFTIGPGETLLWVSQTTTGYPVDGTHKAFKLDPGSNNVNCTVAILG